MSVIAEVEKLAFSLPENERAKLAERLWESLPEDFIDEAEIEEALRRDREMDEDPSKVITLEQLDTLIANRPRRK
ncbi:MAG: addiction module protein [Acidobacteriota bacterium]|jgi:putative addiction module component (TIGR02574 family)|nr:addiction module protein [Blastocatellia bacterium]MDQ3490006.1 addiction module protein [Acidobacteriota bacterium]